MSAEIWSNIIVIAANLIVGGRLLKQGIARGATPELLLGASLAFDGLEWLLWMLAFYTPLAETPHADHLTAACRAGIVISVFFLLLFIRTVFRPASRWALAFALLVSFVIASGFAVGLYFGDWTGFASDRIWLWLELGGVQVAYVWCFAEAAPYYQKMRRRSEHGLADPVVTNRMLLWVGYAATGFVTELAYMSGIAVAGPEGSYPFLFDAIMIATTTAGALLIVLAFFPPPAYLRWISAGVARAADEC